MSIFKSFKDDAKKDDEEDGIVFDFPFSVPWYGWALMIVAGILFSIFVLPILWVKDKLVSLKDKYELAMAFHRCNDF